jgi:hypothetical protein
MIGEPVHRAYYSSVLNQPPDHVWRLVRDFNNYPRYIEGVTESIIEDGRRGDEIGAVRRFNYGGAWIRQRLAAHSDADRAFTYAGMEPFPFPAAGRAVPAPIDYRGTLRLTPVIDGDRTFVEWFVEFDGNPDESEQWTGLLLELIPQWVDSLRRTLAGHR